MGISPTPHITYLPHTQLPAKYGVFGGRHIDRYPDVERKNGIPGLVVINEAGDVLQFDGVKDVETKVCGPTKR